MSNIYAVNFAPGFEELVTSVLEKVGAEVLFAEEAFALIKLQGSVNLEDTRFAKSVIEVFGYVKISQDLRLELPDSLTVNSGETFNIRNFESGRPIKMDEKTRIDLIRGISTKTKLRYSAFEPDVDFVVAKRRDGMSYFGYKLPTKSGKKPQKGEIHPDVANLLIRLGGVNDGARVLDAFAGYGGISKELITGFNPAGVTAVEKNSSLVNKLKSEFGPKSKVRVVASDVVNFLRSTELEFDLIIADPPWGEFEGYQGDLKRLYFDFLTTAQRKLVKGGKIVILSSNKEVLDKAATESRLVVGGRLNVLISGKKVLVLVLSTS